jgi:hypothetical protein
MTRDEFLDTPLLDVLCDPALEHLYTHKSHRARLCNVLCSFEVFEHGAFTCVHFKTMRDVVSYPDLYKQLLKQYNMGRATLNSFKRVLEYLGLPDALKDTQRRCAHCGRAI